MQAKQYRSVFFLFLEYTAFLKAISHDKESRILQVKQSTYTDDLDSIYTTSTVDTPTYMRLNINTKSGIGYKHEVHLITTDVEPKIVSKSFVINQVFYFYNLKQGGYYNFKVIAYSTGDTPMTKEHTTYGMTYPAKPSQYSTSPTSGTTWVRVQFYAAGKYHGWKIQLVIFTGQN